MKNIFFGAVIYEVIHDIGVLIYDLADRYLQTSFFLSGLSLPVRSYIFCAISILLGFLLISIVKKLDVFHDKKDLPVGHMVMLLVPSLLYFIVRDFQMEFLNSYAADDAGFIRNFYAILFLLALCVLTMSIMTNKLITEQQQQQELRDMELLFSRQRENYLSKISAEKAINQKYHDLKNCLLSLQADSTSNSETKEKLIEEIGQILTPLESDVNTGNEFMNVVVKEKIQICQEKAIRLTPYIDARCLGFMDGLDICVLAGNLLDNAIEAVAELPECRREIHVKIFSNHAMASFHFHNFYDSEMAFDEKGLPKTTKSAHGDHGYGLKSVKQISEKYHGSFTVWVENGEFNADVLIPIPQSCDGGLPGGYGFGSVEDVGDAF
ncbi:MAG: GHKL domain-containing protein [Clostridiales bacterium]|nr:GHKL domain-containing protein [Clostridiales bacterium]